MHGREHDGHGQGVRKPMKAAGSADRYEMEEPEHPYLGGLVGIGAMAALYCSSFAGYILFHALVEVSTIAIALTLFILTWHTRRFLPSGSLLILGIGYGFIAGIDLLHTLAYKGMGTFPGYGANLPTQLWIAARSLQAVLLCVAPVFARRGINGHVLFGVCLVAVSATTALVFSGAFPDCFIEGKGLTPFKIFSEYVICALLGVALLLFIGKRTAFSAGTFTLIISSILCTIGSELAFTTYLSVYGPANMVGHFLKLAAFYLIYRALVVTGLKTPFDLIFRDLRLAQESLMQQREFNRCLLDSMADGVVACDADGTLTLFNRAAKAWHGLDPMRLPPEEWARHYDLFRADGVTPLPTAEIPLSLAFRGEPVTDVGMAIVATGQPPRFILANGSEITDAAGHKLGAVVVMRDITAFRRLEQELRETNQDLERRVAERTAALQASEERFRTLFEGVPDALVIADLDTGIIHDVNPGAGRLFGRSREALIGRHQSALHPATLEERTRELFRKHAAQARAGKQSGPMEHVILRSDGAEIPVEILTQPVTLAGRPMVQGSFRDITERKRAEAALHRLNRELRAISSCNQALMKAEDEQTLLTDICRLICDEAGYSLAWVGYAEHDEEKTIRPVAWAGVDSDYVAAARTSWSEASAHGQGPAGLAIRSGEPAPVQDFATEAHMDPWRDAALARGYRSGIGLPLKDENGKVFGVLLVYSTEPYAVTAEEFKLLEELAGDLAFGITVLRARSGLKRAEQVAQARLRILETAYTADISLDDMLRRMLDEIEAQTGSSIAFYHFMEEDQQTLSLQNWSTNTLATMCTAEGKGRHYPVAAAGVWADCVREQRPVIHNSYATLPHRKGVPTGHAVVVRELVVPVFRGPRIVAIIGVGNKPEDYTETDVQIAELLGDFSWEIVIRKRAEEELNESEERLRMTLEATQIGIFDFDVKNDRWFASPVYYTMLGYEPKAGPGDRREWLERVHPDDRTYVEGKIRHSQTGECMDYQYEARLRHADGSYRWQYVKGFGFERDLAGNVTRMLGIRMDIHDRKQAEEEIKLLTIALDHVQEGAFLIDLHGKFLYVNQEACRSLEYARDELIGRSVPDIDPDFPTEKINGDVDDLFKEGSVTFESRHRARSGRVFPVEITSSLIEYGGSKYTLSLVRDISERKRLEQTLKASEEKFRTLAENSPDNVARYDVNCRTVYINPTLEKTLGCPAAELLGSTPMETPRIDKHMAYQKKIAGVLATGEAAEMDITMPDRGEGGRYHNIRFVAERGADGAITGVLAIGRDITERQRAEEELHRLKEGLEQRVRERTAELEKNNKELERMNRLFVGRELRMVELKKRIKELEKGKE